MVKLTGDRSFDIDHSLLGAEEGGSIGDYAKSRRLVDPTFEDKVLLEDFRPRPVCPRVEHLGHCKFVRRRKEHICEQSTTTISDNNCSNNECFHCSVMKNVEDLYFYAITYHGKGEDRFCLTIIEILEITYKSIFSSNPRFVRSTCFRIFFFLKKKKKSRNTSVNSVSRDRGTKSRFISSKIAPFQKLCMLYRNAISGKTARKFEIN